MHSIAIKLKKNVVLSFHFNSNSSKLGPFYSYESFFCILGKSIIHVYLQRIRFCLSHFYSLY